MATHFTDFVLKLAHDPSAVQELRRDPEATCTAAGLSAAERTVLMNGDPALIRSTVANELGIDARLMLPFITLTSVHVHIDVNVNVVTKNF